MPSAPPFNTRQKIAVLGSGAAALGAAWKLSHHHDVTIFEKNAYVGGHANTVEVSRPNCSSIAVDTGFIVYNERTYPNLIAMFDALKVATQTTDMSFGVSLDEGRLEYSGGDFTGLIGQKRNILRPRFWGMIRDILRFYREAPKLVSDTTLNPSLGEYLTEHGYGEAFLQDHLLPMAAAIWSAPAQAMLAFPARSFIRFCANHGLLQIANRPQWLTVVGGSREYVKRLLADYKGTVHLNSPIARLVRLADAVELTTQNGVVESFDQVVIGTHADEALNLLADPSEAERRLLGAFEYQPNLAILHSDLSLMPKRTKVWSSWNYLGNRSQSGERQLCVTYWMNRLQSLDPSFPLFVTLNPITPPDPQKVHWQGTYHHPVFNHRAMTAQTQLAEIQGHHRTWYCGSYFGYGFHEDAFSSGLALAKQFGESA